MNRVEPDSPDPNVATTIATWMPKDIDPRHIAALNEVLPEVRSWIEAVLPPPRSPKIAGNLLRAATHMALWWLEGCQDLDVGEMMTPHNIEHFMKDVCSDRPRGWQVGTRSSLRRIGRSLNPGHHWSYVSEVLIGAHPHGDPSEDDDTIEWGGIGDAGATRATFDALVPDVQRKIVAWGPRDIDPEDAAAVEIVLPEVKSCVVAVKPSTPKDAATLLWASTRMALWWYRQSGNLDVAEMWTPQHIREFTMVVNADRPPPYQRKLRLPLQRVARTINPDQWPQLEDRIKRPEFESLSPEVAALIVSWGPRDLSPEDAAVVEIVLPSSRSWVAAANPTSAPTATRMLYATTLMALWWHQQFGNLDPEAMFTWPNIEHFVTAVNADRARDWQVMVRAKLRRVAQAANPSQWPRRDVSMISPALEQEQMAPEVAEMIAGWTPGVIKAQDAALRDPAVFDVVMPATRSWVAATNPPDALSASSMLWATARMASWSLETTGSADSSMFTPRNVDLWATAVNSHRSHGWRLSSRSLLRRVGRAVNPQAWPEASPAVGHGDLSSPYTADEEGAFLLAADLPGAANRGWRLWAAGASLGAGLNGAEFLAAHISDIFEVADDRLAVQVRGRNERLVPIRACWTQTVRQAISLAIQQQPGNDGRFICSDRVADAAKIANQISIGDQYLRLRRARATWVAAHLRAGTALPTLRKIAGPLSTRTLDAYCAAIADDIDAAQAVMDGLRA